MVQKKNLLKRIQDGENISIKELGDAIANKEISENEIDSITETVSDQDKKALLEYLARQYGTEADKLSTKIITIKRKKTKKPPLSEGHLAKATNVAVKKNKLYKKGAHPDQEPPETIKSNYGDQSENFNSDSAENIAQRMLYHNYHGTKDWSIIELYKDIYAASWLNMHEALLRYGIRPDSIEKALKDYFLDKPLYNSLKQEITRAKSEESQAIKGAESKDAMSDEIEQELQKQSISIEPIEDDQLKQTKIKMLLSYKLAVQKFANSHDMDVTELFRRSVFIAMRNPQLLDSVDDMEQEYISKLGPSRHHK